MGKAIKCSKPLVVQETKKLIEEYKAYLPFTIRGIYYRLLSRNIVAKDNKDHYVTNGISDALARAREDGIIPWNAIVDNSRRMYNNIGFDTVEDFVDSELANFMFGYSKNLLYNQDVYIELWVEKDTLSSEFSKIAKKYNLILNTHRGQASVTRYHNYQQRVKDIDKRLVILSFTDLDPWGIVIEDTIKKKFMEPAYYVENVEVKRIALTPEDRKDLPTGFEVKITKSTKKNIRPAVQNFIDQYGNEGWELDALDPKVLIQRIEKAVLAETDSDLLKEAWEERDKDIVQIAKLRKDVEKYLDRKLKSV